MTKQNHNLLQRLAYYLVDKMQNIASSFTDWSIRIMESIGSVTNKTMEFLSAITGRFIWSESAFINIVTSATLDVVKDTLSKETEKDDFTHRVQKASEHLSNAATILDDLEKELGERSQKLEHLLTQIQARQADAEHWEQIATISEQAAKALTEEIEKRVRDQIRAELDRGKTRRRIFSALSWFITLILGGIVGAVIQQWWQTGNLLP